MSLQHGSHGAVDDEDALFEGGRESVRSHCRYHRLN
jgi:hypothetical protein